VQATPTSDGVGGQHAAWPTDRPDQRNIISSFNLLRYSVLITPVPLHHSSTLVSDGAGHSHSDTTFLITIPRTIHILGSRPLASQQQVTGQFREASFRRFHFSFDCTAFKDIDGTDLGVSGVAWSLAIFLSCFRAPHQQCGASTQQAAGTTPGSDALDALPSRAIPTS
jgi:hypothetical protein